MLLWADGLVAAILRASLHGAVFIALVWVACRLVPRMPAGLRGALWWLACLKLLLGLVTGPLPVKVPLPVQIPTRVLRPLVSGGESGSEAGLRTDAVSPSRLVDSGRSGVARAENEASLSERLRHLGAFGVPVLAVLWLAGLLVQLMLTRRQLRAARDMTRDAETVESGRALRLFENARRQLGVARAVRLRVADVEAPLVAGLLRPTVILPRAQADTLSDGELSMVLAHELVHVRRGDLWLGWLPVAVQRLFFFHPLATLALREYALAREAACDAEVLRLPGASPHAYGRLLLELGVRRGDLGAVAAGAAPSLHALRRRLRMLQQASPPARLRFAWWVLASVAVVGLAPFQVVAIGPVRNRQKATCTEAREAEADSIADRSDERDVGADRESHSSSSSSSSSSWSSDADESQSQSESHSQTQSHSTTNFNSFDDSSDGADRESIIITSGNSVWCMDGSSQDADRARELARREGRDLLLFRRDHETYVIRDASLLRQARRILEPQNRVGRQQAELGAQQAELGARQAELGTKQAELGERQAELGAKQAKLVAEQAARGLDDRTTDDLDVRIRELGRMQGELGRKQGELGSRQGELGKRQSELGSQQGELGQHQRELADQARVQFRELVERAIASRQAERL